ncbi:hydrogenase maturation protease [Candidatus Electrothrix aarhusensis]|uniref:Hydrogenase maturation protease n=1 Tax=Candidatus Electrothrix aarhusensis TaxID=1859131 RepID=A0A3S3QGI2_9BACT|nr:hydrogenase maturation protease [Candidatus Electrothrix aarhusensis]
MKAVPSVLVYGFGNPGREDDGAGVALAERIRAAALPGVSTDSNYQLNVEDALLLTEYDIIIFADATRNPVDRFSFYRLQPDTSVSFTTHAMSPGSVLALCSQLYGKTPPVYMLEIAGVSFELREGMTAEGKKNTLAAGHFLKGLLERADMAGFEAMAGLPLE